MEWVEDIGITESVSLPGMGFKGESDTFFYQGHV
jgi:hypothetical protein